MINLEQLRHKESIITADALQYAQSISAKYAGVLGNILRIKLQNPSDEDQGFARSRKRSSNTELLLKLQQILTDFEQSLNHIHSALAEQGDNPQLNKQLLNTVEKTIAQCVEAYEDKAKSFAVILNDLEAFYAQITQKMDVGEDKVIAQAKAKQQSSQENLQQSGEKLVYIRLFHKNMSNLNSASASKAWIKPLLESIKSAEKHGLAIYAEEQWAKRSIKNEGYAYATLRIKQSQDITDKRPAKQDPNLHCPLLTIEDAELDQLVKFTYKEHDYLIADGRIQLSTTDKES